MFRGSVLIATGLGLRWCFVLTLAVAYASKRRSNSNIYPLLSVALGPNQPPWLTERFSRPTCCVQRSPLCSSTFKQKVTTQTAIRPAPLIFLWLRLDYVHRWNSIELLLRRGNITRSECKAATDRFTRMRFQVALVNSGAVVTNFCWTTAVDLAAEY
jgi:hypothetical protein